MSTPIQSLNLTRRATNALLAEDMTTVEQVAEFIREHGRNGLLRIPNLGRKWANEVMGAVGVEQVTPAQQRDALLAAIEQARLRLRAIGTVGVHMSKETVLRDSVLEMFERCVAEAERAAK